MSPTRALNTRAPTSGQGLGAGRRTRLDAPGRHAGQHGSLAQRLARAADLRERRVQPRGHPGVQLARAAACRAPAAACRAAAAARRAPAAARRAAAAALAACGAAGAAGAATAIGGRAGAGS